MKLTTATWFRAADLPDICINPQYCKKCGICIQVCPRDVYQADREGGPLVVAPDQCIWCERCEVYCPDFALVLKGDKPW